MLAQAYYAALRMTGLSALARRLSGGALILCYHNVVEPDSPPFGDPAVHLAADRFETQMRWLRANYDVLPLGDLAQRLASGDSGAHMAAVTFDDAYGGVFEYAAPILRALKLPATVFVVADAPDRVPVFWWDHPEALATTRPREHLLVTLRGDRRAILPDDHYPATPAPPAAYRPATWGTIRRAAAAGFEIGSHSCTHRTLTELDDNELRDEVSRSRKVLAREIGQVPGWFAYPYGIWDPRVREAVADAGYRGALVLDAGLNTAGADPLALHRVNVPASISLPALEAWAAGLGPHGPARVAA
jgi:peptidoglycan/xylan/chitin deacetylase (PgdA/CDA1 family)